MVSVPVVQMQLTIFMALDADLDTQRLIYLGEVIDFLLFYILDKGYSLLLIRNKRFGRLNKLEWVSSY